MITQVYPSGYKQRLSLGMIIQVEIEKHEGPALRFGHRLSLLIFELSGIAEGVNGETTHSGKIGLDFGVQETTVLGGAKAVERLKVWMENMLTYET